MNNQRQLSKFGKFVFAYFSYFSLSGIFALLAILTAWLFGGFTSNTSAFLYVFSWCFLYFFSTINAVKTIFPYKEQESKKLPFYTFMWVIVTFWPCLLYGMGSEDNVAIGLILIIYILAAYPYLLLAFGQIPGLILLLLFPLFHTAIFYISWKKTHLLYDDINNSFKLE
ncbi:hypothetical protein [Desulfovibrio sp. JC010]|uniref:hypothetical protein n=1 Tax=Desulfovibrio sp. JC010 TaxID=2593641 RepID=UPI0013D81E9D|nr:hypothetical protein [Desulfovibrio sp. JC010]NDV25427.1 hypothetical protein [Desulfovibrio sp. JC010]